MCRNFIRFERMKLVFNQAIFAGAPCLAFKYYKDRYTQPVLSETRLRANCYAFIRIIKTNKIGRSDV